MVPAAIGVGVIPVMENSPEGWREEKMLPVFLPSQLFQQRKIQNFSISWPCCFSWNEGKSVSRTWNSKGGRKVRMKCRIEVDSCGKGLEKPSEGVGGSTYTAMDNGAEILGKIRNLGCLG